MTVHAPFNFVTLSGWVYTPEWADRISHDIPFSDGLSGEFDITITAHSKILMGGKRKQGDIQTVEPFQLPDGTYAIPERSLRGMIRNVLEIAAFGRMKFADDKRFGIRDLTPSARAFYGDHITTRAPTGAFKPLSLAGWLRFDPRTGRWEIDECEFARIEHSDLAVCNGAFGTKLRAIKGRQEQDQRFARCLYNAWDTAPLENDFWVAAENDHLHSKGRSLRYKKAYPLSKRPGGVITKQERGTLVFTGQPAKWKPDELTHGTTGKKHLEFVFLHSAHGKRHIIPPKIWSDFLNIHEGGEKASDNWGFWKDRYNSGASKAIPVFFLLDNHGAVQSLGLAMMFKLAHQNSVHEMIGRTSKDHLDESKLDLATAIFGEAADEGETADGKKQLNGLKSRVNMGLAKCAGYEDAGNAWRDEQPRPLNEQETVLAGPKPSYFPIYVRQPAEPGSPGRLRGETYATYTVINGLTELNFPEIRGWKRYPAGRGDTVVLPPAGVTNDVKVLLKPLPPTTRFVSKVRFHNLRPVELGALLWALEWGGCSTFRHRLGMGKPYGYGQISAAVDEAEWKLRPNRDGEPLQSKGAYIRAFIKEVGDAYSEAAKKVGHANCSWAKSEQILQLLAMADPATGRSRTLEYLRLEMQGDNQFSDAKRKRTGKDYYEILPAYTDLSPNQCPDRDQKIWRRKKSESPGGGTQPHGGINNSGIFSVGEIVIDKECGDQAKIVAICEIIAEIEYVHDKVREKGVPIDRLKK